ncbi:hypothetical protein O7627_25425 [Solwaraspora sp. WMMD1047]|uniref:hypothetical protein n=1 Tax=Solwaraspora sp. WMMD1047 TaxID=3016102 RepID=UPI002416A55B|nr:hypothetical protein [Solwaraspora sp. WMMD1047]MDG4832624.1 hypothetical protein [Solwaraspora sp. WMMD1047]
MTAFDLSPSQIRNRRILLARRALRRHWQRTSTCPVCGSRPLPLSQALRFRRRHDPGESRRAIPRQDPRNDPRYAHPEDRHAREIMDGAPGDLADPGRRRPGRTLTYSLLAASFEPVRSRATSGDLA